MRGLTRMLVTQVEYRAGLTSGADSSLWFWAFRHAGWILTRFGRRRDIGMTPYAKLFCKQYRQLLLMFAEAVITRRPGAHINKLEHQWLEGLWVGRDGSTDEHLIASGGGILRCRAVQRMTEDRRWLAARFRSFQWTPWAPSAVQRGRPPKARGDAEPIRVGALGRETPLDGSSCRSTSSSTSCNWRAISADRHGGEFHPVQFFFVFFVIFLSRIASSSARAGSGDDRPCCRSRT